MNLNREDIQKWGSIFFILLLLAFKCADLHQFSHDGDKAKDSCTICQLAHSQHDTDAYIPPQPLVFNINSFSLPACEVEVVYHTTFISKPYFGIFLNKAPPVA